MTCDDDDVLTLGKSQLYGVRRRRFRFVLGLHLITLFPLITLLRHRGEALIKMTLGCPGRLLKMTPFFPSGGGLIKNDTILPFFPSGGGGALIKNDTILPV